MEKQFTSNAKLTQLNIEGNANNGIISLSGNFFNTVISGVSAQKVYDDFLQWLEEYSEHPQKNTSVFFEVFYSDTPSTLFLTKVCGRLFRISDKSNLKATWHYSSDDEAIHDLGQELQLATSIELQFKTRN
ncbi:MAG TPA: SiaC family regulatory phosphoprotein [Williamwhitmania sp.]|jgi:hypothetical protein|nr:SiaC family regulatory phosphoprotein [Williamwhitmania sp.]